jgi:hypothetical protein
MDVRDERVQWLGAKVPRWLREVVGFLFFLALAPAMAVVGFFFGLWSAGAAVKDGLEDLKMAALFYQDEEDTDDG